jgi:hypothetical protein
MKTIISDFSNLRFYFFSSISIVSLECSPTVKSSLKEDTTIGYYYRSIGGEKKAQDSFISRRCEQYKFPSNKIRNLYISF